MIYNISSPNITLDSIQVLPQYTFSLNGLILFFIIVITLTLITVICAKKMII